MEPESKSNIDEMHEEHNFSSSDVMKGKKSGTIYGDPIICFGS